MPIRVLDAATVGRIAAGEVVERPASIVKELVENSLDAGATSISVEMRGGGIDYLRVTDNGSGIAPGQVRIAFENHATSKIQSADQLDDIRTLGFRGEALPSIAAVSKVELTTKSREAESGVRYTSEGGSNISIRDTGCPQGTTIIVRDLFFNIPVRRAFLKKPAYEGGQVNDVVSRLLLGNPGVSFRLQNGSTTLFHSPGDGKLRHAVYAVYGRETAEGMTELDASEGGMRIWGLIGTGTLCKATRAHQMFFINGRSVRCAMLTRVLERVCRTRVTIGMYPMCILNLRIPPASVDVNVHPNKLEVRFRDDNAMEVTAELLMSRAFEGEKVLDISRLSQNTAGAQAVREVREIPVPNRVTREETWSTAVPAERKTSEAPENKVNPVIAEAGTVPKQPEGTESPRTAVVPPENEGSRSADGPEKRGNGPERIPEKIEKRETAAGTQPEKGGTDEAGAPRPEPEKGPLPVNTAAPRPEERTERNPRETGTAVNAGPNRAPDGIPPAAVSNKERTEGAGSGTPAPERTDSGGNPLKKETNAEKGNTPVRETETDAEEIPVRPARPAEKPEQLKMELSDEAGTSGKTEPSIGPFRILGTAFKTYILLEMQDRLLIIDQHAAHERLQYERFMARAQEGVVSQALLVPMVFRVSSREMAVIEENLEVLESAGYSVEPFGMNEIRVTSVPFVLGEACTQPVFMNMLGTLYRLKSATLDTRRGEIIQQACKSAVKGGDPLTMSEIESLLRAMMETGAPPTCPHGRPVVKVVTQYELEKLFKRIQ